MLLFIHKQPKMELKMYFSIWLVCGSIAVGMQWADDDEVGEKGTWKRDLKICFKGPFALGEKLRTK